MTSANLMPQPVKRGAGVNRPLFPFKSSTACPHELYHQPTLYNKLI